MRGHALRRVAFIGVLALISTVAMPSALAARTVVGDSCSGAMTALRTFHVEAVPSKKVVRPGEKFAVDVVVTRPAHEDPAGQGITFEPPVSAPAEDVIIGISIWVGDRTYFWGIGLSNADGKATLRLKVPTKAESGKALASASGRRVLKDDCPEIMEDGYATYDLFLTVKR